MLLFPLRKPYSKASLGLGAFFTSFGSSLFALLLVKLGPVSPLAWLLCLGFLAGVWAFCRAAVAWARFMGRGELTEISASQGWKIVKIAYLEGGIGAAVVGISSIWHQPLNMVLLGGIQVVGIVLLTSIFVGGPCLALVHKQMHQPAGAKE